MQVLHLVVDSNIECMYKDSVKNQHLLLPPDDRKYIEESATILVKTLQEVGKSIKPGVTTLELSLQAEEFISSYDAKPSFKGYYVGKNQFQHAMCISVNEEVVHGIPSERALVEGDIVTLDCGVYKNGYHADSAYTFAVGSIDSEKQLLLDVTQKSLEYGVAEAKVSNKIYDIARVIQTYVEQNGFSVVRELTGHGIGKNLHQEPSVPNFVPALLYRKHFPNEKLVKGMTIAIEPMVNVGTASVLTAADKWTIITADRKPSAHFEHTIIVDNEKPIILTLWN